VHGLPEAFFSKMVLLADGQGTERGQHLYDRCWADCCGVEPISISARQ
jgi:hypothetical protein